MDCAQFAALASKKKDEFLAAAVPTVTKKATAHWICMFEDFCHESGTVCALETVEEDVLSGVLENFTACFVGKTNQAEYKRSSYLAARGAIHCHGSSDKHLRREVCSYQQAS